MAQRTKHPRAPRTVTLAAAQIWGAKTRAYRARKHDPALVQEHFRKYNIGSSTYDPDYCHAYGEEYLTYLDKQVGQTGGRSIDLLLLPEFCFTPGVVAAPMEGVARNPRARADAVKLYTWSGRLFADWLCRKSREAGMFIGASSFTVRDGHIYNTGLLADERGKIALRYEKIHLPWDEKLLVTPGMRYTTADTRLGRIGFSICYDLQYPEHHACLSARGVEIVLHPSGGYGFPDEGPMMGQHRLRIRASDHFAALVYACFAPESDWEPRESCVIAPNGDVKAYIRGKREGLAVGEVTIRDRRTVPADKPDGMDFEGLRRSLRRPATYGPLMRKAVARGGR